MADMRMAAVAVMLVGAVSVSSAQTGTVNAAADIYGRPGWVLENGTIRVALLRGGGHIAEVRLVSTNPRLSINPMFIPSRPGGYMGTSSAFPTTVRRRPKSALKG